MAVTPPGRPTVCDWAHYGDGADCVSSTSRTSPSLVYSFCLCLSWRGGVRGSSFLSSASGSSLVGEFSFYLVWSLYRFALSVFFFFPQMNNRVLLRLRLFPRG